MQKVFNHMPIYEKKNKPKQSSSHGNAVIATKKSQNGSILKNGAGDEARTRDIFLGKEAFYH